VRRLILVLSLGVAASACGGKKDRPRLERHDGAAAVVVVDQRGGVRLRPEVEPNDSDDTAMALPLPGGGSGELDGETDVDRYVVTVDQAGYVRATLSGIEGADLVLEIGAAGAKPIAVSDIGGALVDEGVPNLPVSAGRYVLAVREFVPKRRKPGAEPRTGRSPAYGLTVALFEPSAATEREPDDDLDTALPLALGGEVEGYVGWRGDVDVWTIPLEGFGPDDGLDVDVDGVAPVELRARIVDAAGATLLERRGGRGEALAVRGWMPGDAADARYALVLDGRRSAFDRAYRVRAARRLIAIDEEIEPNDAPVSATPLAAEPGSPAGQRRGYLVRGDTDYYAVPAVVEPSGLALSVDRAVEVSVVDGAGAVLAAPTREVAGLRVALPAGVRAFVVLTRDGGDEVARAYTLRWSLIVAP
jgi:hypothetical protein